MRDRALRAASPAGPSALAAAAVSTAAAAPSSTAPRSSARLGTAKARVAPHAEKRALASRSERTAATYHGARTEGPLPGELGTDPLICVILATRGVHAPADGSGIGRGIFSRLRLF